jgi:hypothetical protein
MDAYKEARAQDLLATNSSVEDIGSIDDVLEKIEKRIHDVQNPMPKKITSKYRCVNYDQSKRRFRACCDVFNVKFNIGDFR